MQKYSWRISRKRFLCSLCCEIAAIFVFCVTGCSSWFFPEFEVCAISENYEESKLVVTFSSLPDHFSFENAFSLTDEEEPLNGRFEYSGYSVIFYSDKAFSDLSEYKCFISTQAENIKGVSLKKDFRYRFTKKTDFDSPRVVSVSPNNMEKVETTLEKIEIEFSKSIDISTFSESFSISPVVDYFVEWSENQTKCTLNLKEKCDRNKIYSVKIDTKLKDTSGNFLSSDYSSTFSYFINDKKLECNFNKISDFVYEIEFSEEVELDSVSSYISIEPEISFSQKNDWVSKKKVTVTLTERAVFGENYVLKVDGAVKDTFGNKLKNDETFFLEINQELIKRPKFITGFIQKKESDIVSDWQILNLENIYKDISFDGTFLEGKLICFYAFEISKSATTLDLFSCFDAFSISVTNSAVALTIPKISVFKKEEFSGKFSEYYDFISTEDKEKNLCFVVLDVNLTVKENDGILTFKVTSDLKDDIGNNLEEDIYLPFNKI